jgi:hypothetical protein
MLDQPTRTKYFLGHKFRHPPIAGWMACMQEWQKTPDTSYLNRTWGWITTILKVTGKRGSEPRSLPTGRR